MPEPIAPLFDAGGDAYSLGQSRSSCPYPPESDAAQEWRFGWKFRATVDVQYLEELVKRKAVQQQPTAASSECGLCSAPRTA